VPWHTSFTFCSFPILLHLPCEGRTRTVHFARLRPNSRSRAVLSGIRPPFNSSSHEKPGPPPRQPWSPTPSRSVAGFPPTGVPTDRTRHWSPLSPAASRTADQSPARVAGSGPLDAYGKVDPARTSPRSAHRSPHTSIPAFFRTGHSGKTHPAKPYGLSKTRGFCNLPFLQRVFSPPPAAPEKGGKTNRWKPAPRQRSLA
jgi:hypothetical protein